MKLNLRSVLLVCSAVLMSVHLPCSGFSIFPMSERTPDPGPEQIEPPIQALDLLDGGFGLHFVTAEGGVITGNDNALTTDFGQKFVISEGSSNRLYRTGAMATAAGGSQAEEYDRWSKFYREKVEPAVGEAWRCKIPGEATVIVQVDRSGKSKITNVVWFFAGLEQDGHTPVSESRKSEFIDAISRSLSNVKIEGKFPDKKIDTFTFVACFSTYHAGSGSSQFIQSCPSLQVGSILRAGIGAQELGYNDIAQTLFGKAESLASKQNKDDRSMKRVLSLLHKAEQEVKSDDTKHGARPLFDRLLHDEIIAVTSELLEKREFEILSYLEFTGMQAENLHRGQPYQLSEAILQSLHQMYSTGDPSGFSKSCDLYIKTLRACNKEDPEQARLYNRTLHSYQMRLAVATGNPTELAELMAMASQQGMMAAFLIRGNPNEKIRAEATSRLADLRKNFAPIADKAR